MAKCVLWLGRLKAASVSGLKVQEGTSFLGYFMIGMHRYWYPGPYGSNEIVSISFVNQYHEQILEM